MCSQSHEGQSAPSTAGAVAPTLSAMTLHTALAATATLLSLAFALSTLERWLARRQPPRGDVDDLAVHVRRRLRSRCGSAPPSGGASVSSGSSTCSAPSSTCRSSPSAPCTCCAAPTIGADARPRRVPRSPPSRRLIVVAPLIGADRSPTRCPRAPTCSGSVPASLAGVGSGRRRAGDHRRRGVERRAAARPRRPPSDHGRLGARRQRADRRSARSCSAPAACSTRSLDEMDGFAISLVVGIAVIFAGFLLTRRRTRASVARSVRIDRSASDVSTRPRPFRRGRGRGVSVSGRAAEDLAGECRRAARRRTSPSRALVAGQALGAERDDVVLLGRPARSTRPRRP